VAALGLPVAAFAISPNLGPGEVVTIGVRMWSTRVTRNDVTTTLWIYLPEPAPVQKVPCVFIAPAGTPLIYGSDLSQDDRAEHIPYVKAGMAVVAYSISGPGSDKATISDNLPACGAFMKAHAGLSNAQSAIDFALKNVNEIDPAKLYTAGHSSAGTLSLFVAEFEPRVSACIAYAPVTDVIHSFAENMDYVNGVNDMIDGFTDFLRRASPINHTTKLKCPVFLFHADDDTVEQSADIDVFYDTLRKTNGRVSFFQIPIGGHFDSMIEVGVPLAIKWLLKLPAVKPGVFRPKQENSAAPAGGQPQ
jgi:dipeptidyl aminopeptidase/acylaminoacyl peptidase